MPLHGCTCVYTYIFEDTNPDFYIACTHLCMYICMLRMCVSEWCVIEDRVNVHTHARSVYEKFRGVRGDGGGEKGVE